MPENSDNTASCGLPKPRGTMSQWFSLGALAVFLIGGFLIVGCCKTFQEAICYARLPVLIQRAFELLHMREPVNYRVKKLFVLTTHVIPK